MSDSIDIALLGRKLGHSLSPEIHEYLGSYGYVLHPLEPNELDPFFERTDFRGLNVTIPYKLDVVKYCAELSDTAKRIGCVNTIVRRADGSYYGDDVKEFCKGYYGLATKVMSSDTEERRAAASEYMAMYIADNNIDAEYIKEYGWDPYEIFE